MRSDRPTAEKSPSSALSRLRVLLQVTLLFLPVPASADRPHGTNVQHTESVRVAAWHRLLAQRHGNEFDKVLAAHRFFAGFDQQDDLTLWGVPDRWVMPREFVEIGAGDCEDFAIARYATLVALGVPASRLSLAATYSYSTERRRIERHMVLAYRAASTDAMWILDNRNSKVSRVEERKDLGRLESSPQIKALETRLIRLGEEFARSVAAANGEAEGYADTEPVPSIRSASLSGSSRK
jgi:predicted transglutaminase-like cysteine proteinase